MQLAVAIVSPPGSTQGAAFDEVGETLDQALHHLGHDCQVTRTLLPGRRHIVLGSHLVPRSALPPDSILYNLEQIDPASPWLTAELLSLWRRSTLWDYSATNIERLAALGLPRPRHVPVGYAPALTRIPAGVADIDVLFYGALNERRRRILGELRAAGAKVAAVFGVYGAARDALIARSRLVLNVHSHQDKTLEVVRVSYLLANGRVVVSERGADAAEDEAFAGAVAFAPYQELVATCLRLLERADEQSRLAAAGLALMRERPQERFLAPALAALQAPPLPDYYQAPRPEVAELVGAPGKRVLEIGCAAGAMGASLLARGASEVVGVERHPAAVKLARTRLTAVYRLDLDDFPQLPYPNGYFDCITFSDVLEHLVEPEALLAHLMRYLAPDGTVVISLPNVRHESVALSLLVGGEWEYQDLGILDRTHLRFFTRNGLMAWLERAGLELDRPMNAVCSMASEKVARAAELVAALGGDAEKWKLEATVIQYLVAARRRDRGGERVADLPDPWAGSRPVRVLLAPDLDDPQDRCEEVLIALGRAMGADPLVTVGVVLPPGSPQSIPAPIERAASSAEGDLLLLARPDDEAGWSRLLAGASMLVRTGGDELDGLAEAVGLDVEDGRDLLK
jgi:2-polyprenyl-3-methyl-5-hydroxy-6-metoxy-1,4-benzoquinol methylase